MTSIVSLNIKNTESNITINSYPILFYWDNDYDHRNYVDLLYKSEEFKNYIFDKIVNIDDDLMYINTKLYVCFYLPEEDKNVEEEILIQDLFGLNDFSEDIYLKYVCKYFESLYAGSFKSEPIKYNNKDVSLILFIYRKLKDKYSGDRINPLILINYIMSKISDDYKNMTNNNFLFIKDKLTNTINNNVIDAY